MKIPRLFFIYFLMAILTVVILHVIYFIITGILIGFLWLLGVSIFIAIGAVFAEFIFLKVKGKSINVHE